MGLEGLSGLMLVLSTLSYFVQTEQNDVSTLISISVKFREVHSMMTIRSACLETKLTTLCEKKQIFEMLSKIMKPSVQSIPTRT